MSKKRRCVLLDIAKKCRNNTADGKTLGELGGLIKAYQTELLNLEEKSPRDEESRRRKYSRMNKIANCHRLAQELRENIE